MKVHLQINSRESSCFSRRINRSDLVLSMSSDTSTSVDDDLIKGGFPSGKFLFTDIHVEKGMQ